MLLPQKYFFFLISLICISSVQGVVLYDERLRGDLSDSNISPTIILAGNAGDEILGTLNPNTDLNDVFLLRGLRAGNRVTLSYRHSGTTDLIPISYTFSDINAIDVIFNTGSITDTVPIGTNVTINIPISGALQIRLDLMDNRPTFADPDIIPNAIGIPEPEPEPEPDPPTDNVDWTISIESIIVPEPSGSLLILSGFMHMLFLRKRTR